MPLHPLAVDRFAAALLEDMTPGDWSSMRDVVSDLVAAFRGQRERGRADVHPGPDAREVVGDLIAKLEAPAVASALQARLWMLSDRPKHRAEGEAWLHANPDETGEPFADENLLFVAGTPFTEDDEAALPRTMRFTAAFDDEAGVWTACSADDIATEAPTEAALLDRLAEIVPDLLESRHGRIGCLTLVVDWREAGRVRSTTLSVG